jgi:dTDP-glucose 4,6-dehydratase
MNILVTGGAGFIGSNFIKYILKKYPKYRVVNYDKLTYAGNLENLREVELNPNYRFVKGDIADEKRVNETIKAFGITHIVNFAAESHVDRSITEPKDFVVTNVVGTQVLLQAALKNNVKHFHHVSTDEVFGTLDLKSKDKFKETSPYEPRSPYSASKAGSDHLVRAYYETYNLPITITNCSNNYGPYQDPEKFIPRVITNLINGEKAPIYGDGKYVRDWVHVEDHCRAIDLVIHKGKIGETYLVGGTADGVNNLEIVKKILNILNLGEENIEFVTDRPGHDRRYAIDFSKIKKELGWEPLYDLDRWLTETIDWYLANDWWWKPLKIKAEKFYTKKEEKRKASKYQEFIKETSIPGLLLINMPTYSDERGFFREAARINALEKVTGKKFNLKQWNHSKSKPRTLRGLHAENWNKIIYPITGKSFSAIADIRPDSPTFGKVEIFTFSEDKPKALFIPKGLANSFCVLGSKNVHYLYIVDKYYDGSDVKAIVWNDPDLNIKWPIKKPIISQRDKENPTLREMFPERFVGK